jgi:hypothetical protein
MTPHYLTYVDYPDLGLGTHDPADFDTACDQYAEARDEGYHATVMRIEPGNGKGAGMALDVTEDAEKRIAKWLAARRQDLPEWLLEAAA